MYEPFFVAIPPTGPSEITPAVIVAGIVLALLMGVLAYFKYR